MKNNKYKIVIAVLIFTNCLIMSASLYGMKISYAKPGVNSIDEESLDLLDAVFTDTLTTEEEYNAILSRIDDKCNKHNDIKNSSIKSEDNVYTDSQYKIDNYAECYNDIKAYIDGGIINAHVTGESIESYLIYNNKQIKLNEYQDDIWYSSLVEREYLKYLEITILDILSNNERGQENLKYFDDTNYNEIINILNKVNNNENKVVNFKALGKTRIDLSRKDLVIMNISFDTKSETIIFKLNDNNKIYDIDII